MIFTPPLFSRTAALLLLGLVAAAPSHGAAPAALPPAATSPAALPPAARPAAGSVAGLVAVPLAPQPRTWMDSAARRLVAQDLAEARRSRERPLVLVGASKLSSAPGARQALFVQLQSPRECGSAGCSTQVFLWQSGRWTRVLDGVSGKLSVAATRTGGMADLVTDDDHYVWSGTTYASTQPAPQIDLRPRR